MPWRCWINSTVLNAHMAWHSPGGTSASSQDPCDCEWHQKGPGAQCPAHPTACPQPWSWAGVGGQDCSSQGGMGQQNSQARKQNALTTFSMATNPHSPALPTDQQHPSISSCPPWLEVMWSSGLLEGWKAVAGKPEIGREMSPQIYYIYFLQCFQNFLVFNSLCYTHLSAFLQAFNPRFTVSGYGGK